MPKSILLVEDDPDLRSAVADALEAEGYAVIAAANGREALKELRSGRSLCLVLLDMRMPVMNGIEFRQEQLRDEAIAEVPVVAFSASASEREEAASLGIVSSLSKPMALLELLETVAISCGPSGRIVGTSGTAADAR